MSINLYDRVRLGRTKLEVTQLGFGMAPLGGLYAPVTDDQAAEVLAHAWELGIRYYDAAPLYGYGRAEQRLGRMLQTRSRREFVISTKVGRLLYPLDEVLAHPEWDRDWQRLGSVTKVGPDETPPEELNDWYYRGVPDFRPVYDYSYDGIMRSVEASLKRTGLDRLDLLWIHDPDTVSYTHLALPTLYPV